jgi:hypothetical protein
MKIRYRFYEVILVTLFLTCLGALTDAQQTSEQESPTLSPPLHAALYPEVMCVHCVVPHWDHGYLVHVEIDRTRQWSRCMTRMERKCSKHAWSRRMPPKFLSVLQEQRGREGLLRLAGAS